MPSLIEAYIVSALYIHTYSPTPTMGIPFEALLPYGVLMAVCQLPEYLTSGKKLDVGASKI